MSQGLFTLLGVTPEIGRNFLDQEDILDGPDVIILSHALWSRRYGADASIVGQTIQVNGSAHQVVGVMPPDFELLLPREAALGDVQLWAPLQDPFAGPRNRTLVTVLARLKAGVSFEQAQEEMNSVAARLREEHPVHAESDTRIRIVSLHRDVIKNVVPALSALVIAVGLVLLIACSNVANLMLARATGRYSRFSNRGRSAPGLRLPGGGWRRSYERLPPREQSAR